MQRGSDLLRLERDWEDLALLDPLWAILSDDARKHGIWDLNEFFATGEAEIAAVIARAEGLHRPVHRRRALDFGCGVGRLTRAMSSYFEESVGVDISTLMIEKARALNRGFACSFTTNPRPDLGNFPSATFDFIYSRIVLQHLPRRALIERYIAEFVRVLSDDGLLVFQVPHRIPITHRLQPRRRLFHALKAVGIRPGTLYTRLGLHPIQMLNVPERRVESIVSGAGGTVLTVDRALIPGVNIEDRTYFVTR